MTQVNKDVTDAVQGGGATPSGLDVTVRDDGVVRLEAPGTGFKDTWNAMGPGIAAAMTGIGASHLIHGPTAGAQFGYMLLWIIPAAYLLKYCAFEFAHRYTMVKGESVMDAYGRVGNWPFWYLAFQSLVNVVGVAGRALGCGAMFYAAFPIIPLPIWGVLVLVTCLAILWAGKYAAVEGVVKIAIIVFALSTFIAFALQAPPMEDYLSNLLPAMAPAGAMILFGSMFGYFPTSVEVSTMQSNWAKAKGSGMVRVRQLEAQGHKVEVADNYLQNSMKLFRRDMNISYVIAMVTGMIFLIIGAAVLHPMGLVPAGNEMGATIVRIYTETFGDWIAPLIIAGGVAALFSTVFTFFDGQATLVEECSARLFKKLDHEKPRLLIHKGFQVGLVVVGIAVIYGLPEPVFLVQIASVLALLFTPAIYWLNIKAVKDGFATPFEREFMPSKPMMALAWAGTVGMGLLGIYVLTMMFIF